MIRIDGASTFALGLVDEPSHHTQETIMLMQGDLALLYTDGITEARSPAGDFFGEERLNHLLRSLPDPITADTAVQNIARVVAAFETGRGSADDQTLLALRRCT